MEREAALNVPNKYRKYLPALAIVVAACVASVLAFLWLRSGASSGVDRIDVWISYASIVLSVPAWMIAGGASLPSEPATKVPEFLNPLFNGLIWGLFILLLVKLWKLLGRSIRGLLDFAGKGSQTEEP
jgi:hypothetical protein